MGDNDAHKAEPEPESAFSVFSRECKFRNLLYHWNQDGLRFVDWWFAQKHVSQPYLDRYEVAKSVPYTETGEDPVVYAHTHNWTSWKICLLGQRFVDFLGSCSKHCHVTVTMWLSVQTERGRPVRILMSYSTLSVSLKLSRRRFTVSLVGVFLPGKTLRKMVVAFGQLISSRNSPLQYWSSPAWNVLLFEPLNLGNKTLELQNDFPGKQKLGLIWNNSDNKMGPSF